MKSNKKGFTLVELVVVVIIVGILASIGMPYYYKTVETAKATDAVAIGHMMGSAYRMFKIDYPAVDLSGEIKNTCNVACTAVSSTSGCRLVACNYMAKHDWTNSSYSYLVGSSCGTNAACVRRVGGNSPYSGWGYDFSMTGGCSTVGTGTPSCPKF
ncbi:MAG: prepilin-type N-terminal cleavage/methylation domain-containing protein [Elusimicrobiota bacterium]